MTPYIVNRVHLGGVLMFTPKVVPYTDFCSLVSPHSIDYRLPILKRSYTVRPELPREEPPGVVAARTAAMAIREDAGGRRDTVGIIAHPVDGLLLLCGHWGGRVRPDLIACRVGCELGPP